MSSSRFKALVVNEAPDRRYPRQLKDLSFNDLPKGNVVIQVRYSSLNYKDALSASGNKGVTKKYPHVPGIDAAGVVAESASQEFKPGDEVIVTGYELGANHYGGFSEYVRVPDEWVVRKPEQLALRDCMIYGTAGLTAGLGLHRLLHHGLKPDQGPVLVTGATGGVGCIAVGLLAATGFHVVAATGKIEQTDFLRRLGAIEVIHRDAIKDSNGKGLLKGRWAGAIDTVGGELLDSIIRQTNLFGVVACCGNVISADLHTSIYPFILRGVSLLGINSAFTPMPLRREVWLKLASEWKLSDLQQLAVDVSLEEIDPYIDQILQGKIRGRIVVTIN